MFDEEKDADLFFGDLIAAVRQQLDSPATPYVRRTFERLKQAGMPEDAALEEIAGRLAAETDAMYRRKGGFDEKSYRASLEMISPEG